jgi:hypothetical protein
VEEHFAAQRHPSDLEGWLENYRKVIWKSVQQAEDNISNNQAVINFEQH